MIRVFITYVLVNSVVTVANGAEASAGDNGGISGSTAILISIGVSITGILFAIICGWPWFKRQFRKICPAKPPEDEPTFAWNSRRGSNDSFNSFLTLDPAHLQNNNHSLPGMTLELQPSPLQNRRNVVRAEEHDLSSHDWFAHTELTFPRTNIHYIQEVGHGWYGLAIEAELKMAGRTRAIVKYLKEEATTREQMKFLDEARLYRDSNHKNILKLLGFSIETAPYLLILEHFPKGDLKSYLVKESKGMMLLDAKGANSRRQMILDIAQALEWMHSNGFTHPDLAARNCLIGSSTGQVIVGDYGLGPQQFRQDYYWSSGVSVPIRWSAPESLECTATSIVVSKATKEANIWTLGVVMWEICELGKFPYSNLTDEQVLERVISDRNHNLPIPTITNLPYATMRNQIGSIITKCFHPIPQRRPGISEIVNDL